MTRMDIREKTLYHQIHPAKLTTDIASSFVGFYLLWRHLLVIGLVITIVPPILISAYLISFVDLSGYERSAFGRYIGRYMTGVMQSIRLLGAVVVAVGAWYHQVLLMLLGLGVVLLAWFRGVLFPARQS